MGDVGLDAPPLFTTWPVSGCLPGTGLKVGD